MLFLAKSNFRYKLLAVLWLFQAFACTGMEANHALVEVESVLSMDLKILHLMRSGLV
jgi:hypothetical protein